LKELELGLPINLSEFFKLVKRIISKRLIEQKDKLDNFFVIYVLSSGLIDDLVELLTYLDEGWDDLPV
jgi:hypothetical protein